VDVFTCGDKVDPWVAYNYIASAFKADKVTAAEIKRGIFDKIPAHT
jgi:S-adenosylmethionine decarboxylase